MKQAAKKKRNVFRTLIRIIHIGGKSDKSGWNGSHKPAADSKNKKQSG